MTLSSKQQTKHNTTQKLALKRLRRRFILLATSIVTLSLLLAFALHLLIYWQQQSRIAYQTLELALAKDTISRRVIPDWPGTKGQEQRLHLPTLIVSVNPDHSLGIVKNENFSFESVNSLTNLVNTVLDNNRDRGLLWKWRLRFLRTKEASGALQLGFLDMSNELSALATQAKSYLLVILIVVIIFPMIAYLLSQRMLRPIIVGWQKQRDFVEMVSHELKTPLSVISADLDVVQQSPLSTIKDNSKWLDGIRQELRVMNTMLNQMLDLARLEDQPRISEKEVVDLTKLADDVVSDLESLAFEHGKPIAYTYDTNHQIRANSAEIRQLILILLDNALKFGDKRQMINLDIRRELLEGQEAITLTVSNRGEAIPAKERDLIFQRFYRGSQHRQKGIVGSGLGLAIAKAITDRNLAEINVYSDDNMTKFQVVFPYHEI